MAILWAKELNDLSGKELIQACLLKIDKDRACLVSSFGAEATVLLHLVSTIDKNFPVLFIDTQQLFDETLSYRDEIVSLLGLSNVTTIYPDYTDTSFADPDLNLWEKNPNSCCTIRKVIPLNKALKNYDVWLSGRKRYHAGVRSDIPKIENFEGRVKVNPLADYTLDDIDRYFNEHNLPRHPLYKKGYMSVGCLPCTKPALSGDVRSGRWAGSDKEECGIHLNSDGKFVRSHQV